MLVLVDEVDDFPRPVPTGVRFRRLVASMASARRHATATPSTRPSERFAGAAQCRDAVVPRRDKLVFNICQNKANNFSRETLQRYLETARAAYLNQSCPEQGYTGLRYIKILGHPQGGPGRVSVTQ